MGGVAFLRGTGPRGEAFVILVFPIQDFDLSATEKRGFSIGKSNRCQDHPSLAYLKLQGQGQWEGEGQEGWGGRGTRGLGAGLHPGQLLMCLHLGQCLGSDNEAFLFLGLGKQYVKAVIIS